MFTTRNVLVAAIAGVVGCIVNSVAIAAMVAEASVLPLIFSLGREFFSVLFAMAMIPIFYKMSGVGAWVTAFVVLNALASLSAKLVWGAGAPWGFVLFVNGLYAIAAIVVYVLGRRNEAATSGL